MALREDGETAPTVEADELMHSTLTAASLEAVSYRSQTPLVGAVAVVVDAKPTRKLVVAVWPRRKIQVALHPALAASEGMVAMVPGPRKSVPPVAAVAAVVMRSMPRCGNETADCE